MKTFACLSLCLAACTTPAPVAPVEPPAVDTHWSGAAGAGGSSLPVGPRPLGRTTRRMSVEQLDRSFEAAFGGGWYVDGTTDAGYYRIDITPFVAPLLGQPDYLTGFRESADLSTTFAKYLDNAASNLCTRVVIADFAAGATPTLVVSRLPADGGTPEQQTEAIRAGLRHLRLLLHGVYVAPGDVEQTARLEALFRETYAANPLPPYAEAVAWIAVCVAATTDPEFSLY